MGDTLLELYLHDRRTMVRFRRGQIGPFIDGFAQALSESGFARSTAREYLRSAVHLGIWMRKRRLKPQAADEETIQQFGAHLPKCKCFGWNLGRYVNAARGARTFLSYMGDGRVRSPKPGHPHQDLPGLVREFEHWMLQHRGVTTGTLEVYRTILVEFVRRNATPATYTARALREFVAERGPRFSRARAKHVVTSLRMFVRFLVAHGQCGAHLVDAIPTVAQWRLSSLPAYLQPQEVERLVESTDLATLAGRRDRAILLLLARLGLRAGDIVQLRLGAIDWKTGTFIVSGKGRRVSRLPLPQDVGDAILAYLSDGRVDTHDDRIFQSVRSPHAPLGYAKVVGFIVNRAAARAQVKPPRRGAHVLRHSAATGLLRTGVPLHGVRALLRHTSDDMTGHYAKVDVSSLSKVAQPWPLRVPSC